MRHLLSLERNRYYIQGPADCQPLNIIFPHFQLRGKERGEKLPLLPDQAIFAVETFTPGPMVEAATQLLTY